MAQSPAAPFVIAASPIARRRAGWLRPIAALTGVSSALLALYVANSPHLDRFGDSPTYEAVANALPGSFISSTRMPGYPVLIALASLLPGGREAGLILLQALLILATVVMTYLIARRALGHGWMAFVIALVIATDVLLAGYVRVEMSETLAVFLAAALVIAALRHLEDFRPLWAAVVAVLLIALMLTRPEWAFLPLPATPYILILAWRRGRLTRRVAAAAVGGAVAVLLGVAAYSTANFTVNRYFGLSAYTNVALLGKVMVYGMAGDASGAYASLIPVVQASTSPWELVLSPPFNDRNFALAGGFARSAILHDPARYMQDVMATAITTGGEHDSQFLRIAPSGPFGRWLQVLTTVDQVRYRAFVIVPSLAFAWMLAAVITRRPSYRLQVLGLLGTVVLYDWLVTSAGTFGEFERLRMPINPIATLITLGTLLLIASLGFKDRSRFLPAIGLLCLDAVSIGFLPRITSTPLSEGALLAVAAVHAAVFVRWAAVLLPRPPSAQAGEVEHSATA